MPDEALHNHHSLLLVAEIAFPNRLSDQFGDSCLLSASTDVERAPQLIVEIKLHQPHDVY